MKTPAIFKRLALAAKFIAGTRNLTVFKGAGGGRLTLDWIVSILSADQEIKGNMRMLRARARELSRNNAVAKSYLKILVGNVLGENGVGYQPQVRNNDQTLNKAFNDKISAAWLDWSKQGNCTVDKKYSFRAIQTLVLKTLATDGEAFIRMVPGFANKHRFALQMIDPDQVDHLFNRAGENGQNEIRMGIEVDVWGAPVAYHINPKHPSDVSGSLERERIPAEYIKHLYDPERVNQTRGVTFFHPCMQEMRMLGGYVEAELVAARVGAAKLGFLQHTDPSSFETPNPDGRYRIEAEPGVIESLPPGMEFKEWSPDHPANAFPAFIKSMLRFIAGSLGVSYSALASDLESVNYSSMRSGLLIERDQWKMIQSLLKENFLQPVFASWISMSLLAGALVLDTRDPSRFLDGKWQSRGWAWVDPLKDIQASILGVGAGLSSRGEIVSESGRDIEEVFEALAQEKTLAESLGLSFDISAAKPTVAKGPKDSVTATDDESDNPQAEVEETGKGTKSELQIVRRA